MTFNKKQMLFEQKIKEVESIPSGALFKTNQVISALLEHVPYSADTFSRNHVTIPCDSIVMLVSLTPIKQIKNLHSIFELGLLYKDTLCYTRLGVFWNDKDKVWNSLEEIYTPLSGPNGPKK